MHGITGLHFAAFLAPCPHPPGSERVSLRLHGKFFTIPRGLQSLSLSVRLVEDTIVGTLVQRVHGKTWIQDTTRVWRERGWMKKSSRAKKIINLHEGIRANTTFVCVCVLYRRKPFNDRAKGGKRRSRDERGRIEKARGMHEKGQEPWTERYTYHNGALPMRNRHFRFTQILSFANKLLGCRSERSRRASPRAKALPWRWYERTKQAATSRSTCSLSR